MSAAQQQVLVERYGATTAQLRSRLTVALIALWRSLGSWRDADQPRWLSLAVPQVLGAQRQMASLTEVYLSALLGDMTGRPVRPRGVSAPTGEQLRGVNPEVEYARPFNDLYSTLGEGRTLDVAQSAATRRLEQLVATDLQLAKTHSAREVMQSEEKVVGYRRVLRGPQSCALCMIASTQPYRKADLMPIHPGCDCGVVPIVAGQDPGQLINASRLEDVHAAIRDAVGASDRGGRRVDYRDYLVTHEHGEIGPVLARRGEHFTGPGDIPGT